MFVKSIRLLGFRNYLEAELVFDRNKTIIIGKNAQGKSNLLEVIQILSQLKSRRQEKDADLVNFDLDEAIIKAEVLNSLGFVNIALMIRRSGRRSLKINDLSKKPNELIHQLYSVSFMADDLDTINGSPSLRRNWIDSVLRQLDKSYSDDLDNFAQILSQRNGYIKQLNDSGVYHPSSVKPSQEEQLRVWDQLFVQRANVISRKRSEMIHELSKQAEFFYRDISGSSDKLELEYKGSQITEDDLLNFRMQDLARSYSNLGPHRDDIEFKLKSSLAAGFASQGEKRTIILAAKLSELELLRNQNKETPILLLDDVLAELDEDRQDYLLDAIGSDVQVIITTTHLGSHLEKWSYNSKIIQIENGRIICEQGATIL